MTAFAFAERLVVLAEASFGSVRPPHSDRAPAAQDLAACQTVAGGDGVAQDSQHGAP